jgi:zinc transport system substrate-binding protein
MKILSVLIVGCLVLAGGLVLLTNSAEGADDLNVCVTLPWQKEMLEWIGMGRITVTQFLGPGANPHGGDQGTVNDLVSASKSMAYFYIGAEMEWEVTNIPLLRSSFPNMAFVNVSKGLTLLSPIEDEHQEETEEDEHGHGAIDGHVWTSPSNLLLIAANVKDSLSELDPGNAVAYEAGYLSYIERVNAIKSLADERIGGREGTEFLVWHPAWRYLCHEYGLVELSFEGQIGLEVTPQMIQYIKGVTEEKGLDTIFVRPQDPLWEDGSKATLISEGISIIPADPLAVEYLDELESFIMNLGDSWN